MEYIPPGVNRERRLWERKFVVEQIAELFMARSLAQPRMEPDTRVLLQSTSSDGTTIERLEPAIMLAQVQRFSEVGRRVVRQSTVYLLPDMSGETHFAVKRVEYQDDHIESSTTAGDEEWLVLHHGEVTLDAIQRLREVGRRSAQDQSPEPVVAPSETGLILQFRSRNQQ